LRKAVSLEKDLLLFLRPFLAFQEIGWIRKYEENHGRIWQNVGAVKIYAQIYLQALAE